MKARAIEGLDPDGRFDANARLIASTRLDELLDLVPGALAGERRRSRHDLRIAAKRLRYVLEIARPALGPDARTGAQAAKRLQGVLGDLNDCDELLPRIKAHQRELRAEDRDVLALRAPARAKDLDSADAQHAPNADRYRGLEVLRAHTAARREVLIARFEDEWRRWEDREVTATLRALLSEPAPRSHAGEEER